MNTFFPVTVTLLARKKKSESSDIPEEVLEKTGNKGETIIEYKLELQESAGRDFTSNAPKNIVKQLSNRMENYSIDITSDEWQRVATADVSLDGDVISFTMIGT